MANYTITEDKSFEEINVEKLNSLEERVYNLENLLNYQNPTIGGIYTIDGIETICIYKDPLLFIDRNHDLCWYFCGSDLIDQNEDPSKSDTISTPYTYGYEYGNFNSSSSLSSDIGQGVINTNYLLTQNIESFNNGWPTVWQKVQEFRNQYSNKWFVPTFEEFRILYNNQSLTKLLQNLSKNNIEYYWCSELNGSSGQFFSMRTLSGGLIKKEAHNIRARLFCTI